MTTVPYPVFRAALDGGHLDRVLMLAREMDSPMNLRDALHVCLLLRDGDTDRFERACVRWLGRFALEARDVGIDDLLAAVDGLDALRTDAGAGMMVLQEVCLAKGIG